jgi:ribosomal protein S18 acetylase RimI-like enzyme
LVVRVTPLAADHVLAQTEKSWRLGPADETVVMTKPLGAALSGGFTLIDPANPSFAAELLRMNGRSADAIGAWTRMVRRLGDDAIGVWEEGRAVGLATVAGALAAIYSVAVDAAHRRKGLATEVMEAAEAWAKERGATTAFLQVRDDNHAAQVMYTRLGYEERYRYHYLQPRSRSL